MSSRSRYLIFFIFTFIFIGCNTTPAVSNKIIIQNNIQPSKYEKEDLDILLALDYQNNSNFSKSSEQFEKLFKKTKNPEYLLELLIDLHELKEYEKIVDLIENNEKIFPLYQNKFDTLLVEAYMNIEEFQKANNLALNLYENDQSVSNSDLVAQTYYALKNYDKSYEFANKSYKRVPNEERVLNLSNLLFKHQNKKTEAIELLEDFAKYEKCSLAICSNLLVMFNELNDLDGTINMMQKIYNHFKSQHETKAQEQAGKMLLKYLLQKNDYLAMLFLEKERLDDHILLQLYKKYNQTNKALELMKQEYLRTSNINIIAQMAILEFESANNKKEVLKSVIAKFKDTLALVDNAMYQNYLGYLLIDFDVDIPQGLILVNLALEKEPNNYAYLDSLAWGEYKLNNCKKAYKIMKKIVDEVGLKDEEIILHWNKIKECEEK